MDPRRRRRPRHRAGCVVPCVGRLGWFTFSGGRFGWIPSLVAFSALGLVIGWAAVSTHWATARKLTSITLAVIGGIAGIAIAHLVLVTPGRLRHEIEAFTQPSWQLTDDRVDGTSAASIRCTSVTREYHVNADVRDGRHARSGRGFSRDVHCLPSQPSGSIRFTGLAAAAEISCERRRRT